VLTRLREWVLEVEPNAKLPQRSEGTKRKSKKAVDQQAAERIALIALLLDSLRLQTRNDCELVLERVSQSLMDHIGETTDKGFGKVSSKSTKQPKTLKS